MDERRPATVNGVNEIVARDLKDCDTEQLATFEKYRVDLFSAPIVRYGQKENVVVLARNGDQVIYYEDVEEGFNKFCLQPHRRPIGGLQHAWWKEPQQP